MVDPNLQSAAPSRRRDPGEDGADTTSATVRLPAAERREQLLEVARQVLAQNGFYETTMAEIADSAGVTKPVLYQHFASKRDLYTAVLEDIGDRLKTMVVAAAADAENPRQQVMNGFEGYINFTEHDPEGFQILFCGTSRQDGEWASITSQVEHSIAAGVADLIQIPDISAARRQALAHSILGLAEGMVRYWRSGQAEELDRDVILHDLVALAWGGLRGLEP